uniref:CoA transferase n=1 Tax=Phenylobacterium glaciei TaxID=2803784 RepID=A0A974P1T0_9CAUL|nr:CoA transferase [Phenylobacterium glaciei]
MPGVRALHRYYNCADGWVAVVCETREESDGVCGVLGVPLPDNALTASRDGHLARALELAFATRIRDGVLGELLAQGCPAPRCCAAMRPSRASGCGRTTSSRSGVTRAWATCSACAPLPTSPVVPAASSVPPRILASTAANCWRRWAIRR